MITYNELYEVLRKERYSEQLQPLTKNFVKEAADYFKDKKEAAKPGMEEDLFSENILKTKKQLENAVSMFKELLLRRKKKILNLVFIAAETGVSRRDFENMLSFEKTLFEKIMDAMSTSDKELNQQMDGGEKEEDKNRLIVFSESVEELLDTEGNKVGPFNAGEIANIEKEIANILVSAKKADYVEEEN